MKESDRFGKGLFLVGIPYGVKTPPVVIQDSRFAIGYRDLVLKPHVLPITLQQDNVRPHGATVYSDFLVRNNAPVLNWPPYSPDFVPTQTFVEQG